MEDFNYLSAKRAIPRLAEAEKEARTRSANYDPEKEPELYRLTHAEKGTAPEKAREARQDLVESHMIVVYDFLRNFPHRVKTPEVMEDLVQEGFLLLIQAVDVWDINKGTFKTAAKNTLVQLYRKYWKEVSLQPQTGIQEDAKIKAYDNLCMVQDGKLKSAEEAAAALGRTAKSVKAARERLSNKCGRVDSYDMGSEETAEAFIQEGTTERDGISSVVDEDFSKAAKEALKNKRDARIVFDFLIMEGNIGLTNNELAEQIKKETGFVYTYQQIYRAKQHIAAALVYKGILDPSLIRDGVGWLDKELLRMHEMEKAQKQKYAYLWDDMD